MPETRRLKLLARTTEAGTTHGRLYSEGWLRRIAPLWAAKTPVAQPQRRTRKRASRPAPASSRRTRSSFKAATLRAPSVPSVEAEAAAKEAAGMAGASMEEILAFLND